MAKRAYQSHQRTSINALLAHSRQRHSLCGKPVIGTSVGADTLQLLLLAKLHLLQVLSLSLHLLSGVRLRCIGTLWHRAV